MKPLLHNIRLVAFALILAFAASYADATVGTGSMPASFSPSNNTDVPVNIGSIRQDKGGALGGPLGGLSVNNLLVYQTSLLQKKVYLQGPVHGGRLGDAISTVSFGVNYATPANDYRVGVTTTGSLQNTQQPYRLRSTNLANTEMKNVCAAADGTLTLTCPPEAPLCPPGTVPGPNGTCITPPPPTCVGRVTFSGNYRWAKILYQSYVPGNGNPPLLVTVKLVGTANPPVASGTERYDVFTIPENATNESYRPSKPTVNCNIANAGQGCETEGTYGFASGYTVSVSPRVVIGGIICTEFD